MRNALLSTCVVAACTMQAGVARADAAADAKAVVEKYSQRSTRWDGPTSGPRAKEGKSIVVLAADMKNGGILGVVNGVKEAAAAIGWKVTVLDGAGSIGGRSAAFGQAMALKPDGIIIDGFNAVEQTTSMKQAQDAHIPMVAWDGAPSAGPIPELGIFVNVMTDSMDVAKAAADYAYIDAKGKPAVVIFTDSTYAIAIAKADRMRQEIQSLGGTVLEYVDTPIAETAQRMPQLTTTLLQKYGSRWTHSLAINDLYFDFMAPSLSSAGIPGDGAPVNIAAGDGSQSAYQRIRAKDYQKVTVADPLNLQGWQLVDELNRALSGASWSGYVPSLHVVTADNVEFDGGPKNAFDPDSGYREQYRRIWGK